MCGCCMPSPSLACLCPCHGPWKVQDSAVRQAEPVETALDLEPVVMTAMPENWCPVPGFPGYDVSDHGRLRSWRRRWGKQNAARILSTPPRASGHLKAALMLDGRAVHTHVHSLVAAAFLGPRPLGLEIRHMDGNPGHNHPSNLRYGTTAENQHDSVRHGTHGEARKTHCERGHEFTAENTYRPPKHPTHRQCRQCKSAASLLRQAAA